MENLTLYFFKNEFFNNSDAAHKFVTQAMMHINSYTDFDKKNTEAKTQAFLINNLAKKTSEINSLNILRIAECNILVFLGYRLEDISLIEMAINKLEPIQFSSLNSSLVNPFCLVKGEACLHYYTFKLKKGENTNNKIQDHYLLFESRKYFSILVNKVLEGGFTLDASIPQKVIVHYCEVLGHLSRYVEPFFLLDKIEKLPNKLDGSIVLAKYILLDAIREKTCDHTNPILLIKIKHLIIQAESSKHIDKRNYPFLKESKKEINEILAKYKKDHGKSEKELEAIYHEGLKQIESHNPYFQFSLKNHLLLNEHSLYCSCKLATKDDLKIESGCDHTRIPKVKKFQLLLEKLKIEFDNARQSFFRATNKKGNSKIYQNTIKTTVETQDIILTPKATELVNSFGKSFSILDKIAVGVNSVYGILTNESDLKKIYFNSYFKRRSVKQIINSESNNLFLIAMYSISQDLDKGNLYSEFHEYKNWRNAIEHDQFYLVFENANLSDLKYNYPDVKHFIKLNEFKEKTMFMLHLCRSAIFTFTWLIRKASIEWAKEPN